MIETRWGLVGLAAVVLASCFTAPGKPCSTDSDCGAGVVCTAGTCTPVVAACSAGETRPCGPEPVGPCRRGTQACVDGAFEATCAGAVLASPETCNGIDDDCDGTVDEGVTTTFYVDSDGDGFGSSASGAETAQACVKPTGFAATNTDCNDAPGAGFAIKPSASELCDSLDVDENCDGTSNEGCGCTSPGTSQVCCAGRGTQRCEAGDGGATLTDCSVLPTTEVCNGIDDDCDGQIDESFALDGGALPDGGALELDGGCTVGLGACTRSGATACTAASLFCSATAGTPGTETCNGLDDDCDGQIDEASAALCAITGQVCGAGNCACPGGQTVCGASCQAIGGACSNGVGACARNGALACTGGNVTCNAIAGTPTTEVCNNLDDNCDGATDEASATLCSATGQLCNAGTCTCPSGQAVCGASCQAVGASCSTGVGACNRSGVIACSNGSTACNAVAASPVSETCNGVDDDCDGTIDNGVTITCYPDGDNDQYATDTTSSQQCPAAGRTAFGGCPTGFVSPATSLGTDCDPASASRYRMALTRVDADLDGYCVGAVVAACVGVSAPPGRVFSTTCSLTDDCDDTNRNVMLVVSMRADADNDTFCTGPAVATCSDGYALPGRRLTAQCSPVDDCNDANAAQFISRPVRLDADGDGYCAGAAFAQCAGNSALPGTRDSTACLGDDCKDNNALATTTCFVAVGYTTEYHLMACGIGLPGTTDTLVITTSFCPNSFSISNLRTEKSSGAGSCSASSANILHQTCTGFDASNCRIVADCVAN